MHYCKCALYVSSAVILLDSKAQQTELEWISSPPSGVSWKLYNFYFTANIYDFHRFCNALTACSILSGT